MDKKIKNCRLYIWDYGVDICDMESRRLSKEDYNYIQKHTIFKEDLYGIGVISNVLVDGTCVYWMSKDGFKFLGEDFETDIRFFAPQSYIRLQKNDIIWSKYRPVIFNYGKSYIACSYNKENILQTIKNIMEGGKKYFDVNMELIKEFKKQTKQMLSDLEDLEYIFRNKFYRCNKCGHLTKEGYVCMFCGNDNTEED